MVVNFLADGWSKFSIKGNPVLSNDPKSLFKNSPDCPILCNWVFDNFTLDDEKALQIFETCVLVNKNLCGKRFESLESPAIFYDRLKLSTSFFIAHFKLLSCELGKFTFTMLYWVILYRYYIKMK